MNAQERNQADRYLDKELTGSDRESFETRLKESNDLKREFNLHRLLRDGIRMADDKRISDSIEKFIDYKRPAVPYPLQLTLLFLVIMVAGILIWNYNEKVTGRFSLSHLLDRSNFTSADSAFHSEETDQLIPVKKTPAASTAITTEKEVSTDGATGMSSEPNIVIKQDQLLVSAMIWPVRLNTEPADSGNAAAGMDDRQAGPGAGYEVEFWVSPVNYQGYRLMNDKLILFGIAEPDAIQLYELDHQLWLKYGSKFFHLNKSSDFEPLMASVDLPSLLR